MDHDHGGEPNGMLSSLPLELLARILNGHESVGDPWHRRLRPLLDPRWRFAARAPCAACGGMSLNTRQPRTLPPWASIRTNVGIRSTNIHPLGAPSGPRVGSFV